MSNIFEIIQGKKEDDNSDPAYSLGIKVKVGKLDTIFAVTEYLPYDELESEITSLKNDLDEAKNRLASFKMRSRSLKALAIDEDASPGEIWKALSTVADNSMFIEHFNSLSEIKRRELADHIFANCNMFTGKGAFFSAHYVRETGLLSA